MNSESTEHEARIAAYHRSRRALKLLTVVGYVVIAALVGHSLVFGNSENVIGFAIALAPWFALVGFTVPLLVAANSRKTIRRVDIARIVHWTAIAYGLGVAYWTVSGGYYAGYFPRYAKLFQSLGLALFGISACALLVTILLFPRDKKYPKHCCSRCGYDLTGAHLYCIEDQDERRSPRIERPSVRCPECGTITQHV